MSDLEREWRGVEEAQPENPMIQVFDEITIPDDSIPYGAFLLVEYVSPEGECRLVWRRAGFNVDELVSNLERVKFESYMYEREANQSGEEGDEPV